MSTENDSCAATAACCVRHERNARSIDWAAVERDYRSGLYSLRELAGKHPCARSSIANRARKDGWTRDAAATAVDAPMALAEHLRLLASMARGR